MALSVPNKYAQVNDRLAGRLPRMLRKLAAEGYSNADIAHVLGEQSGVRLTAETVRRWRHIADPENVV